MHFTREPIIETVISSREGYKLLIRNTKGERTEYRVEALEIVSFGVSHFYRSTERTNPFLLPVTDFEVVEFKDMKMPLKLGGVEKAAQVLPRISEDEEKEVLAEESEQPPTGRYEKKRERRRGRRRRGGSGGDAHSEAIVTQPEAEVKTETESGAEVAPSFISKLFPPPPTLIKETLNRYKIEEELPTDASPTEGTPESELRDIDDETKFED
jgi:hypothetical protein